MTDPGTHSVQTAARLPAANGDSGPLLLDDKGVAKVLGVSPRFVWKMNENGTLGPLPLHLGKCTRWRRDEITAWVESDCPARAKWLEIWSEKKREKSGKIRRGTWQAQ